MSFSILGIYLAS